MSSKWVKQFQPTPHPSACWLHLETPCPPQCLDPHHLGSQEPLVCLSCHHHHFHVVCTSCHFWPDFCYQQCGKDTSSSILCNTSCTCRLLWPMVIFCCFKWLSNIVHIWHSLPHCLLITKVQFTLKSPPSLLLVMARVSGSDKLFNFGLIYRKNG